MRRSLDFKTEPGGAAYYKLLEYSLSHCPQFLLVVREGIGISATASQLFEKLSKYLVRKERLSEWPGTRLLGNQTAEIYTYKFNPESVEVLKTATEHLYGWSQPDLPEDLCLLRENGEAWLTSIAHEKEAYLSLDDEELRLFLKALPEAQSYFRFDN